MISGLLDSFATSLRNRLLNILMSDPISTRIRRLLLILFGASIGPRTKVCEDFFCGKPVNLSVGESCFLNRQVFIDSLARVTIGDNVAIGFGCKLITSTHRLGGPSRRCGSLDSHQITVENGVWIGANVAVLPGVTIGRGSVVAAGSTVVDSVPPGYLVGGSPARLIRDLGPSSCDTHF